MFTSEDEPILRTLKRADRLQRLADIVRSSPETIIDDIQPIVDALTRRSILNKFERSVAIWLTMNAKFKPDHRSRIVSVLGEQVAFEANSLDYSKLAARWLLRSTGICLALSAYLVEFGRWDLGPPSALDILFGLVVGSVTFTILSAFITAPVSVIYDRRFLADAISSMEVLGFLGDKAGLYALSAALARPSLRAAAAQYLPRIVDSLTADDYGALPSKTVPALCAALPAVKEDLALVILKALSIVGDGSAIHAVEFAWLNNTSPAVRSAAAELIPIIQERLEEGNHSSMLLRPSSAVAQPETVLLRAVTGAVEEDKDQLLRAGKELH